MKKNICKEHRCVSCCYQTEMLLLDEDVKRIVGLGYEEQFFAAESKGFMVLKNSKAGRCVFHDGIQCSIYENRPKGCKLYPVILNEDSMSAVRDDLCPYTDEFNLSTKAKQELLAAYKGLLAEKSDRIKE